MTSIYDQYRGVSDERWLDLLVAQAPGLPRLPEDKLQQQFVGSSGRTALAGALKFYQVIKGHCARLQRPIAPASRILDFGCGWGRIIRFFMKDVPPENLCGVDVDPTVVAICKETLDGGTFITVNAFPPADLPDAHFDIIFAYSVFSHLSEDVHLQWVKEFSRLLKPGGLVFATTQKRSFIDYCNDLTPEQATTGWHKALLIAFRPRYVALSKYDAGEFVFTETGGGAYRPGSQYGEAAVSERYVERHWPPSLRKIAFDSTTLAQALIVAQK